MDWNELKSVTCADAEGEAKAIIARGDQLTFAEADGALTAQMTKGATADAWRSMRSAAYELKEMPSLKLPENMSPTGDVSVGHILITDAHHDNEPHFLLQVICKDEKGQKHLYGLLRSIKTMYDAGPGPRSHNGYYHLPL